MEDLAEAGHVARWSDGHYLVFGPTGIEIGMIEPVDDAWEWVEFTTEYERGVETAPRSLATPEEALHAMLDWGGWLV